MNLVETIYRLVLWLHVSVTLLLVCLSSFLLIGCFLAFLLPKKKLQQPNPQQAICVLVPTFNSQATLCQCIDSILNSNYPPKLIEVKILDDGSTDETLAYLDDLENQQHATKITVLRYTHRGKAAALQQTLDSPSLRNSSSEILFVVDSDTILSKDALSEMVVEFADPAVMACSALIQIREPKHLIEYLQQFEYCFAALTQLILERIFGTTGYLSGQTMAVRKSFLDQCGGIPQNLLTEDYSLFLKILLAEEETRLAVNAVAFTAAAPNAAAFIRQRSRWSLGFLQSQWRERERTVLHLRQRKKRSMALVFVHFDRWFFAIHALVAIPYLTFLTCYWFPVEAGLSSWIRHLLYTGTFLGAFRYLGLVLTGEYPIDLFYLFGAIAGVNFVALYFVALRLCRQPLKLYGVALLFVPYVWLLTFSFQVAVVRYRKAERRKFIA